VTVTRRRLLARPVWKLLANTDVMLHSHCSKPAECGQSAYVYQRRLFTWLIATVHRHERWYTWNVDSHALWLHRGWDARSGHHHMRVRTRLLSPGMWDSGEGRYESNTSSTICATTCDTLGIEIPGQSVWWWRFM